jgi:hypothetical protein
MRAGRFGGSDHSPPPLAGGGWGEGVGTNTTKGTRLNDNRGFVPLSPPPTPSRKGRGKTFLDFAQWIARYAAPP